MVTTNSFTDAEVKRAVAQLGIEYIQYEDGGKKIQGVPAFLQIYGYDARSWNIFWEGDLILNPVGQLNVGGHLNLENLVRDVLVANRQKDQNLQAQARSTQGVVSFDLTDSTHPEDLQPIAEKAGMRIVCTTGFSPVALHFVPDISRAGEILRVRADDFGPMEAALTVDLDQRPVVLAAKDLEKVLDYLYYTAVDPELYARLQAALQTNS